MKRTQKRKNKSIMIITLLILTVLIMQQNTYAAWSNARAGVKSKESGFNFNENILFYPNTNDEIIRLHSFVYGEMNNKQENNVYSIEPEGDKQHIKNGSLKIKLSIVDPQGTNTKTEISIDDILKDYDYLVKYVVTYDRINYVDVTDEVVANNAFPNDILGYGVEITSNKAQKSTVCVDLYHEIEIDESQLTDEELNGSIPLEQWLDSKYANTPPTGNWQKPYIINPLINGVVKYQKLDDELDIPSVDLSNPINNITVLLVDELDNIYAETKTNDNGEFKFSNLETIIDAVAYHLPSSKLDLRVKVVAGAEYTIWNVLDDNYTRDVNKLNIGNIVDISRNQETKFVDAFSKVIWNNPYDSVNIEGANAKDSVFILTDLGRDIPPIKENPEVENQLPSESLSTPKVIVKTGNGSLSSAFIITISSMIISGYYCRYRNN